MQSINTVNMERSLKADSRFDDILKAIRHGYVMTHAERQFVCAHLKKKPEKRACLLEARIARKRAVEAEKERRTAEIRRMRDAMKAESVRIEPVRNEGLQTDRFIAIMDSVAEGKALSARDRQYVSRKCKYEAYARMYAEAKEARRRNRAERNAKCKVL